LNRTCYLYENKYRPLARRTKATIKIETRGSPRFNTH